MTDAERMKPSLCGDLLDDFPCVQCKAKGPSGCPMSAAETTPLRDQINETQGLANRLRREATAIRTLGAKP